VCAIVITLIIYSRIYDNARRGWGWNRAFSSLGGLGGERVSAGGDWQEVGDWQSRQQMSSGGRQQISRGGQQTADRLQTTDRKLESRQQIL
jgi:hypothetical protein